MNPDAEGRLGPEWGGVHVAKAASDIRLTRAIWSTYSWQFYWLASLIVHSLAVISLAVVLYDYRMWIAPCSVISELSFWKCWPSMMRYFASDPNRTHSMIWPHDRWTSCGAEIWSLCGPVLYLPQWVMFSVVRTSNWLTSMNVRVGTGREFHQISIGDSTAHLDTSILNLMWVIVVCIWQDSTL